MRIMRVITVVSLALGSASPRWHNSVASTSSLSPSKPRSTLAACRSTCSVSSASCSRVTVTEHRDGLNLRYQIEVFGRAPEVRLFTPEDNLATGPVPYGAPTHQEIIRHITPKEFSSPVMDFSALARWLAQKTK